MYRLNAIIALVGARAAPVNEQARGQHHQVVGPYIWEYLKDRVQSPALQTSKTPVPADCIFPIDVLILQDATDSFSDNIASMTNTQLDLIVNGINSKHPNSRFGVVSFKDKPIAPLGNRDDYCSRMDAPLSANVTALKEAYKSIISYGGNDAPENQFGTLYNVLNNPKIGWSTDPDVAKLVVISTDAGPHFAGDSHTGLLPAINPVNYGDEDLNICLAQYYPSPEQVKAAVQAAGVYVASLVYDGDWAQGWPSKSWITFNSFLGQSAEFVASQAPDSSNFWQQLSEIVGIVDILRCQNTTTPAPVTTAGPPVTTAGPPVTTLPPTTVAPIPTTTPVPTPPTGPCVCPCTDCACCPEVVIKLQNRPKQMHLDVSN